MSLNCMIKGNVKYFKMVFFSLLVNAVACAWSWCFYLHICAVSGGAEKTRGETWALDTFREGQFPA